MCMYVIFFLLKKEHINPLSDETVGKISQFYIARLLDITVKSSVTFQLECNECDPNDSSCLPVRTSCFTFVLIHKTTHTVYLTF